MEPFRDEARKRDIPPDEVERWLATARPCVTLDPAHEAPAGVTPAGRIGGLPPMPEGEPVPELPLLAVVDLAAVPPGATNLPLPPDGTLLFFADTDDPWTDDDWHRLVYVPAGTPVSERGPGGEWPPRVHPVQPLHPAIEPSLPNRGEDTDEFPHGDDLGSVWWNTNGEMQKGGTVRLGGYPWVWNNDPIEQFHHEPGDWVLLASIGGEGLTEYDLGIVSWVMRREDLIARRFDLARAAFDMV